jgi:hypothetical protein
MSWHCQYELTCDSYITGFVSGQCLGGSGFKAATRPKALEAAIGCGWVEFKGMHYCPRCWPIVNTQHLKAIYPDGAAT